MTDIVYMKYRFAQSRTYKNRYYCQELGVTVARQGDENTIRPWCAWRGVDLSGKSEWFEHANGHQRVFKTADACIKAVIEEWPMS